MSNHDGENYAAPAKKRGQLNFGWEKIFLKGVHVRYVSLAGKGRKGIGAGRVGVIWRKYLYQG